MANPAPAFRLADAVKSVKTFEPTGNMLADRALFEDYGVRLRALTADGSIRAAMAPPTAPPHAEDAQRIATLGQLITLTTAGGAFDTIKTLADGRAIEMGERSTGPNGPYVPEAGLN